MIKGPKIEDRAEQPTLGIRAQVPMSELPKVIPELTGQVFAWMDKNGLAPAGAPFIRYHVINMATKLDIEIGAPVARGASGDGRVEPGVLPAGRYAKLIYIGDYAGLMDANAKLLEWGAKQGLKWDQSEVTAGDAFGARFESYLKDPMNEPDPTKYETEVAIRLA